MNKEDLLFRYPYILEKPINSNKFLGLFCNHGNVIKITMQLPEFPLMNKSKVQITKGLHPITFDTMKNLENINIFDFMQILESELEAQQIRDEESSNELTIESISNRYQDIIQQLETLKINTSYNITVCSKFKIITISNFPEYENHFIELSLDDQFNFSVAAHSLPDLNINDGMFKTYGSMESHLQQFISYLQKLNEFYCNINTIDELCWVVDPVEITTKSNTRTFRINDKVYIKIIIDPLSPSSIQVNLIGPSFGVEPLIGKFNEKYSDWDMDMDIYKNLLRIFDLLYFPMKKQKVSSGEDDDEEEDEMHCNICLMYKSDKQIPIVSCDNSRCDLIFHINCLRQWFQVLLDSKTFLNVTFGTCPACKTKLSTSFVSLLNTEQ